jgi:hypothetical protein
MNELRPERLTIDYTQSEYCELCGIELMNHDPVFRLHQDNRPLERLYCSPDCYSCDLLLTKGTPA